jgi:hypothetical protein
MGKKMEEWGRGWKMRMEDGEMNAQPTIEIAASIYLPSSTLHPPPRCPSRAPFFFTKKGQVH